MTHYTPAQEKALELGKSVCVTAGAGTGKTFLLTRRYLTLLENGALPKDIVALTYTEKAASEMQTKISSELKKEAATSQTMQKCFESFSQGTISTFHGFCLSILKEFAYEAGLDSGFSVMDELDTTELVNKTITDILENPPDNLYESIVHLHVHLDKKTIATAIKEIARIISSANGREWFETLKQDPEIIRESWLSLYMQMLKSSCSYFDYDFLTAIKKECEDEYLLSLRDEFFSNSVNRSFINRLEVADESDLKSGRDTYRNLALALSSATNPSEIRRIAAATKDFKIGTKKSFPISEDELACARDFITILRSVTVLPGKNSELFRHTRSLLLELYDAALLAEEKITQAKRRAGALDFDDLIEKTDELLSDKHPEILEMVSSRYRYILVDEVQDNDPKLVRLVRKLCGSPKENDRLFIVGDPKQSIYLFRKADVAGFIDFQNDFPEVPVALDTSFRSTPEIIEFVNQLFGRIFHDQTNSWDPVYDSITPFRKNSQGTVSTILLPYQKDKKEMKKVEAETLASWISDAICINQLLVYQADGSTRCAEFSDVAILIEKRTSLPELKAALDTYHIPYEEVGGRDFYQRQETFDLWNVLNAVLFPEKDVVLYGALRSPYFSVSDAELCIAATGETEDAYNSTIHFPLISRLSSFAKANKDSKIARSLELLSRLRDASKHLEPLDVVMKLVSESEILSVYAGIAGGARMESNLLKLLDILRSRAESRQYSLYEFVELLSTSIEGDFEEAEGDVLEKSNAVKIITVHSSKGLEYPIVCVCFAGSPRKGDMSSFISDDRFGSCISVKLPWTGKNSVNILKSLLKEEHDAKDAAEHKRLFYVALTRARDHLVICGTEETKEGYSKTSFLKLYDDAKSALSEQPICYDASLCSPLDALQTQSFVPVEISKLEFANDSEEMVGAILEVEAAKKRGILMHEIFAGNFTGDSACNFDVVGMNTVNTGATDMNAVDSMETCEYFKKLYHEFLSSTLMKDVVREWCELPVTFAGEQKILDRLVEYKDGRFAVIDYKTGKLDAAKKSGLFVEYEKQVLTYVRLIRDVLGQDVEGWLYFAEDVGAVCLTDV